MIFGDFRTTGLEHSYQIEPPGYSQPQKLYHYYYKGFMLDRSKNFVWKVGPPFFIIDGQGTSGITIEMIPTLSKYREKEISGITRLHYTELDLQIDRWKETRNLYYRNGPLWKIIGNKTPTITYFKNNPIETRETYTMIPLYEQNGYPPKYSTGTPCVDNYNFKLKNGKILYTLIAMG